MFFRRYDGAVSDETLIETSQVAIVEETPPAGTSGVRRGYPLVLAEPTNDRGEAPKAYLVSSPGDLEQYFGKASPYIGSASDGYDGNLHVQAEKIEHLFPLVLVTVDAEAGEVTFTRPSPGTATLLSGAASPFCLEAGDTILLKVDGGGALTATFDADAALLTGAAATYAGCVASNSLDVKINGGATQSIECAGTENTQALWHDLLNAEIVGAGAINVGGQTRITSDVLGTDSGVEVLSSSDADVLAALGLSAASDSGGGDVGDITAVTAAEVVVVFEADFAGTTTTNVGGTVQVVTDTAGGGGSLECTGGTGNDVLLFSTSPVTGGAGTAPAGTIAAGSRVTDATTGKVWLTLEPLIFVADALTGTVRVRAASGVTGTSALGDIDTVTDAPSFDSTFTVANAAGVTAVDLDTKYSAAATISADPSDQYARRGGFFVACRHTESVMSDLTAAVVARSSVGRGAALCTAPPVGTNKATAEGSSGVGVAATAAGGRSDRRWYAWSSYIGRTAITGSTVKVEFTSDLCLAAFLGQLDPEESPGELRPELMVGIVALGPDAATAYADFVSLKASGIIAPRIDPDLGAFFQDAVTSSLTSGRTSISRRTMTDFLGDSIGAKMLRSKDLPFRGAVRNDAHDDIEGFLEQLKRQERIFDYTCVDLTSAADRKNGILRLGIEVDLLGNIGSVAIQMAASPGLLEITESPASA